MSSFCRPRLVISKCIEFERCRWNGEMINSDIVKRLMPYCDMLPVCMEVEIGLGVPRDPVRVVKEKEGLRMVQPATGRDVTDLANEFCDRYLSHIGEVDGFLLKSRSPSCGIKDVKVYPPGEKVAALTAKERGFFGRAVLAKFGHLAIEDEARLLNMRIGEHFLTQIFAFAELRDVKGSRKLSKLVDMHSRYKLLLMSYSHKELRTLGNIVANREKRRFDEVIEAYSPHFYAALSRPPRCGSGTNVLLHAFGYLSDKLNTEEKALFLDTLKKFNDGKVPMTVPIGIIKAWVARFDIPYLRQQRFLQPFPDEFLEMMSNDACLGRDLWADLEQ
ncbi:MAG: DUF1722 domain-containing protein [Methanomassiliicoccales archaeon]|nr:MAG: DUF1722 domain-containing protein [Methanomassiliicoccales archaeon]